MAMQSTDENATDGRPRRKPSREQAERKAFWKRLAAVAAAVGGAVIWLLRRRRGA
jgi:hypothetical protein